MESSVSTQDQSVSPVRRNWFLSRPIPVWIIAAFCTLQFLGISMFMASNWPDFRQHMAEGLISPLGLLGKLLYPFLFLIAGISLLLLRKVAIALFVLYFFWGVAELIAAHGDRLGYMSLALTFGIIVYALRLRNKGLLQ
jgi:hypothetical protein